MTPSVVIVSNRLPISIKKTENGLEFYPSVGGLATGLAAYVNDKRNKWIGWPGIPSDNLTKAEREEIAVTLRKSNCYPVFLTQKQLDDYYNGYSNSILWPVFHDLEVRPDALEQHDKWWKSYKSVNSSFAGVVLALTNKQSTIWVHDYQLLGLPQMLRAVRPLAKIGFFLHIPFPSLKHFKQIPSSRKLLDGLLGADLIGMHTKRYTENFLKACSDLTKDFVAPGQVMLGTHLTQVTDFPMGIDYERFTKARELSAVKKEYRKHQRKYRGLRVILTVDRLDPTKGLVERLQAYQLFLRQNPSIRGKVIMVMLAVPSRTEIEEYKELKEQVESLIRDITKEFGTSSWQPIDYLYTSLPVESVTALYQVADVAFITPIRDGMNLVAKEYIASRPKHDGVLILSSTAGAAQELTDALLVNPKRPETLVEALNRAIKMPKRELRERITNMDRHIAKHTVQAWAKQFMGTLQQPVAGSAPHYTRSLTRDRVQDITDSLRRARHPVMLLDYDGVLAQHVINPAKASPSKEITGILKKFSSIPQLDVAIISGRSQDDLINWLGDLPITLVAEHGASVRNLTPEARSAVVSGKHPTASQAGWKRLTQTSPKWQNDIEPILVKYAANTPGAHVEIKDFSLVWHFRGASPYYAQKNLVILRRILKRYIATYGLEMHTGDKILEIKPSDVNKGAAATQLITEWGKRGQIDFVLCLGDDYTDEDMFEILPVSAYTIKVGRGTTSARLRARTIDEAQHLLKKLAR
jgi:trehalose 6-phosphate synthase/phosphatase